jgi:hypothetical protein
MGHGGPGQDEGLMDEISRLATSIDTFMTDTYRLRMHTLKCDFVPSRSGKVRARGQRAPRRARCRR